QADADAVLDRAAGVEHLQLGVDRGADALGDRVESDERGVAEGFDDVVVDPAAVCPLGHALAGTLRRELLRASKGGHYPGCLSVRLVRVTGMQGATSASGDTWEGMD